MPIQQLSSNNDAITDCLTGLRHYNDKKRWDAINGLIRMGHGQIAEERVGDVVSSLGFGLSDEDDTVRTKCSSFLYTLLNELDESILEPFHPRICMHIRAALANVKPGIRFDGVQFLHRVIPSNIFSTEEVAELIKSLVELNSAILPSQSNRGSQKSGSQDVRKLIWKSVEGLLEHVAARRSDVEQGFMNPTEWTVSAVLSRVFSPHASVSADLRKLLVALTRQGEDAMRDRIEELSIECDFFDKSTPNRPQEEIIKSRKRGATGSVFSKLSLLTREDSD